MHKVIFDCDNTLGVQRSDIDDGLTFAYLYAHPEVELLGITCTFANNHEHVVYYNTRQMMEDLEIFDVPVLRGGRMPGDYDSEAVEFLVAQANRHPGEITLIATGSLCNVAGAYTKDPSFFNKIKGLIVMGGLMGPLHMNGVHTRDLNFSVDHRSSVKVLFHCKKLTILSAQCTRDAVYGEADIRLLLGQRSRFMTRYVDDIRHWLSFIDADYGGQGKFINWDLCTAIYLTRPELFEGRIRRLVKSEADMENGMLVEDLARIHREEDVIPLQIPERILDVEAFNQEFFEIMKHMK